LPKFLKAELSEFEHIKNEISQNAFNNFKGNMLFSSKFGFIGYNLARRDDIISVIYLLVFLINGRIEKYDKGMDFKQLFEKVSELKNSKTAYEFCTGQSHVFAHILDYAYNL
jgi:hypothetical protein